MIAREGYTTAADALGELSDAGFSAAGPHHHRRLGGACSDADAALVAAACATAAAADGVDGGPVRCVRGRRLGPYYALEARTAPRLSRRHRQPSPSSPPPPDPSPCVTRCQRARNRMKRTGASRRSSPGVQRDDSSTASAWLGITS